MSGKTLAGIVILGLFFAAGLFTVSPLFAGSPAAFSAGPTVSAVSGSVQVMGYGQTEWFGARAGLVLKPGDLIRTGPGARVEIRHYSGTTRLYENTILAIPSIFSRGGVKDLRKVDLEKGAGIFHLEHNLLKGGFEVRTRQVIAGVKGTTFAVQADGHKSSVAVLEGRVSVAFRDGPEGGGQPLMVGPGRRVEARNEKGIGKIRRYREKDAWKRWETGTSPGLNHVGKGNPGLHKGSGTNDQKGGFGSPGDNGNNDGETGYSHDQGKGKGSTQAIGVSGWL